MMTYGISVLVGTNGNVFQFTVDLKGAADGGLGNQRMLQNWIRVRNESQLIAESQLCLLT